MAFDPAQFLASPAEPMATQTVVCPEGEWPFMIDSDPKGLVVNNLKGVSQKTGNPYDFWQMEINCICVDETVKAKLGRDKVTVRMRVGLDIDEAGGGLSSGEGKNVQLGRLRAALNQNNPGWKPNDLLGAGPFIGKVAHTTTANGTYADIQRATKIS